MASVGEVIISRGQVVVDTSSCDLSRSKVEVCTRVIQLRHLTTELTWNKGNAKMCKFYRHNPMNRQSRKNSFMPTLRTAKEIAAGKELPVYVTTSKITTIVRPNVKVAAV